MVSQFLLNGQWNEAMVRRYVPPLLVPRILSTQIHYQTGVQDIAIWQPNESGIFSCSSAWDLIRQKKDKIIFYSHIWHKQVPFKVSFFLWRTLRNKIPTNDKICSFGVEPASCVCCMSPGLDSSEHIFITAKYGGKKSSTVRVQHMILRDTLQLLKNPALSEFNWAELITAVTRCKQELKISVIKWEKPPKDILNTDGSALNNPGKIGGGGILRDCQGNLVYAFTIPLGIGTNNQAETQAAAHGIYWCVQHG
ncbi:hypothetical protein MTR67_023511 [Solanum verrucosum]|uniref:RNase H type-1 domain-containing protein n=1 Tax=Solanum verrucosum TaxID=315347 RepID=A0AAF0TRW7_SOLVR|nr:hypothetical protein MTR67_023511 [Solanum verrucosum]